MIHYFDHIEGVNMTMIPGQDRFAFSLTDSVDFYDMSTWEAQRDYKGDRILFYDLEKGTVHCPFEQKPNVLYGEPLYVKGEYLFLQGDFQENMITCFKYTPGEKPVPVVSFHTEDVDTYNLRILGDKGYIISQDDTFTCYYPERFSFSLKPNEVVVHIEEDKVYLNAWIEEDWDEENHCAGENYRYYEKLLIKDFEGNLLKEETGSLCQMPDGSWWVS